MEIEILHLSQGAALAKGITVIIDVFRAFSVQGYAFSQGAEKIYTIAQLEEAYQLKKENPEYILIGEREGKKLPGFLYGNSPSEMLKADLARKTLIHTTSAGTQGIIAAKNASEILLGAFTSAAATARYIRAKAPDFVSLVCMGVENRAPADEDNLCAVYLRSLLLNESFDRQGAIDVMRRGTGARFFERDKQHYQPEEDFWLCTEFNRFDFAIRVGFDDQGLPYSYPFDV